MQKFARPIASLFGVGFLPQAPGTWASAYAAALSFLIQFYFGSIALLVFCLLACLLSLWSAEMILKQEPDLKDPSWIVMDEVAGQSLAFLYLFQMSPWLLLLGFALFRLFDILKPWPVSYFDQKVAGSPGILADDLMAGFMAGIGVFLAQLFFFS